MANEEKQVNEVQFLKSLNANQAAAKAASKEKRPDGVISDAEILKRFGLEKEGDTVTVSATVSKIQLGFAKKDTSRPFFRFAYSVKDSSPLTGLGKGTLLSTYHELTEGKNKTDGEVYVYRTVEEAYAQMYYEFQGIGEQTDKWANPVKDAIDAAKKHTKEKTEVSLTLSAYWSDKKKACGLNIRVNPVLDNSDLEPEDDDLVEPDEETNDDDTTASWEEWVNGWVTWEDESGPDNAVDVLLTSFDTDSETFCGTDEEGNEYTDIPTAEVTWCENQRDE